MKAIIESIKQRILTTTTIQDVRKFNKQVQKLEEGKETLYFPSVLIELESIVYEHKNKHYQTGNCVLNIHLVNEDYIDGESLDTLIESVSNTLNGYSDGLNFHKLVRNAANDDEDYSNVIEHIISFDMHFVDYIESEPVSTVVLGLDIRKE